MDLRIPEATGGQVPFQNLLSLESKWQSIPGSRTFEDSPKTQLDDRALMLKPEQSTTDTE
jgi:hypothetical protein